MAASGAAPPAARHACSASRAAPLRAACCVARPSPLRRWRFAGGSASPLSPPRDADGAASACALPRSDVVPCGAARRLWAGLFALRAFPAGFTVAQRSLPGGAVRGSAARCHVAAPGAHAPTPLGPPAAAAAADWSSRSIASALGVSVPVVSMSLTCSGLGGRPAVFPPACALLRAGLARRPPPARSAGPAAALRPPLFGRDFLAAAVCPPPPEASRRGADFRMPLPVPPLGRRPSRLTVAVPPDTAAALFVLPFRICRRTRSR